MAAEIVELIRASDVIARVFSPTIDAFLVAVRAESCEVNDACMAVVLLEK